MFSNYVFGQIPEQLMDQFGSTAVVFRSMFRLEGKEGVGL